MVAKCERSVDNVLAVTANCDETSVGAVKESLGVELGRSKVLGWECDRLAVLQCLVSTLDDCCQDLGVACPDDLS